MSFNKKPKTINPDEVDPSVYYYDEVYDDMKDNEERERTECSNSRANKDRKSKYIEGLKETAELRKTEKELRQFKKYARDREEAETEGSLANEEVFITSSYKKRLTEIKELEKEKLSRLESGKSDSMNFFNRRLEAEDNSSTTICNTDKNSEPADDGSKEISPPNEETLKRDDHKPTPTIRRKLKTIEDRREYLREVLAKRTVGKVYEEAVQRYKVRKAFCTR